MCTVSYIPKINDNGFLLTSNRDEKEFRQTINPEIYTFGDVKVSFPKDALAGGSWIAINDRGRLCCLLNGGFKSHKKQSFHTLSRGKILLELTSSEAGFKEYFEGRELSNVEPFTIVAIQKKEDKIISFCELIWDGEKKHFRELNIEESYIWSSATLYSEENRKKRKSWFTQFLTNNNENISLENVFEFHSGTHTEDNSINLIMERENGLKTVSITQVVSKGTKLQLNYNDLLQENKSVIEL